MRDAPRVLVVSPTFNEARSLAAHVRGVLHAQPDVHVLVVDDASPDGTGRLADALAVRDGRIQVLHRTVREGLGPAYVAGFRWALAHGYDRVVEMDADGSHLAGDLPRLLAASAGADVVVGSRWVPGGSVEAWSWSRRALSRAGNGYARLALGLPVADPTAGFRVYRADVLRTIGYESLTSQGYAFQVEATWRCWTAGARIVEVPITFVERSAGSSKMSSAIVAEAVWRVTAWGARTRLDRLPPVPSAVAWQPQAPATGAASGGAG